MPVSSKIDKQKVLYSHNGITFGNGNKWSTDICYKIEETWKHYAESVTKKPPHITWFHLFEKSRIGKSIDRGSKLVPPRAWGDMGIGRDC